MRQLAGLLLLFGAGSIVLNLMEMEFRILSWIDSWGEGTGWAIRIGMLVVGAGLWLMGGGSGSRQDAAE